MNSHVQQLQLATWQVGAKGLVGQLSNPLYCTWIMEMYQTEAKIVIKRNWFEMNG